MMSYRLGLGEYKMRFSAASLQRDPDLGAGYRAMTGELRGHAIEAEQSQPVRLQEAWNQVKFIETEMELMNELEVHASAQFSSIGGGRLSASLDFYRRSEVTSYDLWLCAKVGRLNGGRKLTNYKLRKPAAELLEESKWRGFYSRHGDRFVSEIIFGGALTVLVRIQVRTSEELQSLKLHLAGSAGGFGASLDVAQKMESVFKTQSVEFECYTTGYKGTLPALSIGFDETTRANQIQAVINLIANFPTLVDKSPRSVAYFATSEVNEADNWPPRIKPTLYKAFETLDHLSRVRVRATKVAQSLRYVDQNPSRFPARDPLALGAGMYKVDTFISNVDNAALRCGREPWTASEDMVVEPDYAALSRLVPPPQELEERPVIKIAWRLLEQPIDAPALEGVTNTHDHPGEAGFVGWVGDPDRGGILSYLRVSLAEPLEGLRLSWQVRGSNGSSSGWLSSGAEYDLTTHGAAFSHFALKLEGYLANYYDVDYCVRVYRETTTGIVKSPDYAHNNADWITGIWVRARTRKTPAIQFV